MNPMLFGKYCLLERISVGGMAEVFRAKPFDVPDFKGYLALKRILPHLAEDDEFIKMFVDEAKLTVQLDHPNIVRIFELGQFQHAFYILMEFISGKDLLALQKTMRKQKSVIPVEMALFIAREISRGMHYAHHRRDADGNPLNIIHRDVSPQNVLIDYRGRVKVIDFGIAKAAVQSTRTQVGVLKGKMGYMSPEQVRGEVLDYRSDVFSIGTVLWEMLTNRRLFNADNEYETMGLVRDAKADPPSSRVETIPAEVDEIVMRSLTADPEDRYESAGAFADAIDGYLARHPYQADDLSIWMRTIFADDLDAEREKRDQFAGIRTPEDVRRLIKSSAPPAAAAQSGDESAGAEKTEIWDAEIVPHEGEDLSAFAAQHTVVQAGGFDASMAAEAQSRDAGETVQLQGVSTPVGGTPAAAHTPMRTNSPHEQVPGAFQVEGTRPGVAHPEGPPRSVAIAAAVAGLLAIIGVAAVVASFALGGEGDAADAPLPGTLVVNVTPAAGIDVLIDGKSVANAAPVTLQNAPVGKHVVEVRAKDYLPFQKTVTVESEKTTPVDVELERAVYPPGAMVLRLPDDRDDVSIYVDGEVQNYDASEANPSFEVPPGRHLFEIRRPGFRPWVRLADVASAVHKEEIVRFVPHDGPIEIAADAGAVVYWNGKRVGEGPQKIATVDRNAVHELRVTLAGGGEWRSALGFPELGMTEIPVDPAAPTLRKRDFGWLQASTGDDWWEVHIDGTESGFATPIPPSRKLPIAAGEHEVTFRRGDTRHTRKVTIEAGETLILNETLPFEWDGGEPSGADEG